MADDEQNGASPPKKKERARRQRKDATMETAQHDEPAASPAADQKPEVEKKRTRRVRKGAETADSDKNVQEQIDALDSKIAEAAEKVSVVTCHILYRSL